jgi:hypothetical protein
MVELEDIVGGEWADWYWLTPLERWHESMKLWNHYLSIGGPLDPEPDTQNPFYDGYFGEDGIFHSANRPVDGNEKVSVIRRLKGH